MLKESAETFLEKYFERDPDLPPLFHAEVDGPVDHVLCNKLLSNVDNAFVYTMQGKSRRPGVWSLKDLIASNQNLFKVSPGRNNETYVIPPNGIENELCGKIVILKPNWKKIFHFSIYKTDYSILWSTWNCYLFILSGTDTHTHASISEHIYTRIYPRTNIHTHPSLNTYTHTSIPEHTYTRIHPWTHTHTRIYPRTHTHTHPSPNSHKHVSIPEHTHTHTHTHIHPRTHIHTCMYEHSCIHT